MSNPPPRRSTSMHGPPPTQSRYDAIAQGKAPTQGGHRQSGASRSGYRNYYNGDETDDIEVLQQKTKELKNESLESTNRSMARLYEAENLARSNMEKLHSQGEQLDSFDHRLHVAKAYAQENEAKTSELSRLNRWFFLPSWGGGSEKKKAKEMTQGERAKAEWEERRSEQDVRRQEAMQAAYGQEDYQRGSSSSHHGHQQQGHNNQHHRQSSAHRQSSSQRQGSSSSSSSSSQKYHGHHSAADYDDVDEQIDRNLGTISNGLSRLRAMAGSMHNESEWQNDRIGSIRDATESVHERVRMNSNRIERMQ